MNVYRTLVRMPGGRRLTHHAIRMLPRPWTFVTTEVENVRLHLDLKETVDRNYAESVYDQREIRFLLDAHREGEAFLDIGANIGFYSLAYARRYPAARILSFEPDPYNAAKFRRNIEINGITNITICGYAVSDSNEPRELNINFTGNRGGNSLLLSQTAYTGAAEQSLRVSCKTLHQALVENQVESVCALKIDIEGFEYPVLRTFFDSAPRSLFPRALVVEALGHTIAKAGGSPIEILIKAGYRLVDHTTFNFMFARD